MGKSFQSLSIQQLQRHIREVSKVTSAVIITSHAKVKMKAQRVLLEEVYACVQSGSMNLTPEVDIKTGHLICRMEQYVCGRNLAVCVGLDDDDPSLIVVTVFVVTKRGK